MKPRRKQVDQALGRFEPLRMKSFTPSRKIAQQAGPAQNAHQGPEIEYLIRIAYHAI
jgi:hypothetical protein